MNRNYNLFENNDKETSLHPHFKNLMNHPDYEASKNFINLIANEYLKLEKNPSDFIQKFKREHFYSMLWELFLFQSFKEIGFEITRPNSAPDFCLKKYGKEFFIEATTVRKSEKFKTEYTSEYLEKSVNKKEMCDDIVMRFSSSLCNKIRKKYWEKAHVENKPFIIAIHDYHHEGGEVIGSNTWTQQYLLSYLYRVRKEEFDGMNKSTCWNYTNSHKRGEKEIVSFFFGNPEHEDVSAIIFSTLATPFTFNRIGQLLELGKCNLNKKIRIHKRKPCGCKQTF